MEKAPVPSGAVPDDGGLDAAAEVIEPLLKRRFAHVYSGLSVDPARHRLHVHRLPGSDLDDEVRSRVTVRVLFHDAEYPLTAMEAARDRVMHDRREWAERGVDITVAGAIHDGSGIRVGTTTGRQSDLLALRERYGPVIAEVEAVTPVLLTHRRDKASASCG